MYNPETYDRTVAIGVDIQNDFCPGGSLAVAEGDEVVEPFNQAAEWVRDNNGDVIFTRDWHPADTTHFGVWPNHCQQNTVGAEFHKGLRVIDGHDAVVSKGMGPNEDAYSGFDARTNDGTILEELINPDRLQRIALVIGGLATDYCVKATTLDALKFARREARKGRIVDVYIVEEAIRAVNINPDDGEKAIDEMKANGAKFIGLAELLEGEVIKIAR